MLAIVFIQYNVQEKVYLPLSCYLYSMIFFLLLIFAHFLPGSFKWLLSFPYLRSFEKFSIKSAILFAQCPKGVVYQKMIHPTDYLYCSGHKFHVMEKFANIKFFWTKIKHNRSLHVFLKMWMFFSLPCLSSTPLNKYWITVIHFLIKTMTHCV